MTEVYKSIAAVQAEMAQVGISKGRKNQQQGYAFRGIDDVYAALSPVLAKHDLCIIPRVIERIEVERKTAKGGLALYVTVHAEFDFVSAKDGSKHTAATYGEAMDTADKATNKAMSAAYKYAAFMTFAIPTEGDNDADAVTHEVAPRENPQPIAPVKCSAADVERITNLAKEADKAIGAIMDAYLVKDLAELNADQAAAAIKRLKLTIDQRNIENTQKEAL
jgi:hypothetical protein